MNEKTNLMRIMLFLQSSMLGLQVWGCRVSDVGLWQRVW